MCVGLAPDGPVKAELLDRLPAAEGRRKAFVAMTQSPEFAGDYLK